MNDNPKHCRPEQNTPKDSQGPIPPGKGSNEQSYGSNPSICFSPGGFVVMCSALLFRRMCFAFSLFTMFFGTFREKVLWGKGFLGKSVFWGRASFFWRIYKYFTSGAEDTESNHSVGLYPTIVTSSIGK